jgi:uncharacterized protein YecT (DUF1311 family)
MARELRFHVESAMIPKTTNARDLGRSRWVAYVSEALKGAPRKLGAALRDTQRAWLQWRGKRCSLPAIDNEGGSIVGPLHTACMLDATARQALWLELRE